MTRCWNFFLIFFLNIFVWNFFWIFFFFLKVFFWENFFLKSFLEFFLEFFGGIFFGIFFGLIIRLIEIKLNCYRRCQVFHAGRDLFGDLQQIQQTEDVGRFVSVSCGPRRIADPRRIVARFQHVRIRSSQSDSHPSVKIFFKTADSRRVDCVTWGTCWGLHSPCTQRPSSRAFHRCRLRESGRYFRASERPSDWPLGQSPSSTARCWSSALSPVGVFNHKMSISDVIFVFFFVFL